MSTPQPGIFALGTASTAYLEFDARAAGAAHDLVRSIASQREPRTTMGGVNLVAGFRPELWREVVPADAPTRAEGFNRDLVGSDGYTMPATQHDAVLWLSGSAYDVIFDTAREALAALAGIAALAEETSSWPYRHDRDLTGFIDGSENPDVIDAVELAAIPEGRPGAGGSILLLQKWSHEVSAWEALAVAEQEQVIGRTKGESVELDDKPSDSHVARTDQDRFGKIFRRNMPYGTVSDHGTMFVGFSADQRPLATMLESMVGLADGVRDTLTRYTQPLTGAYYFVPSAQSLRRCGGRQDAGSAARSVACSRGPTGARAERQNAEMADPSLPTRRGDPPRTTSTNPHTQLDQQPADVALVDELSRRVFALPGVVEQPSGISVPGARALTLAPDEPVGPPEAFMVDREFAHLHPSPDHSLHAMLPPEVAQAAIDAGWAELHPVARMGLLPSTAVMLYAPRDEAELAVVERLVEASHRFARNG
jgi:putative iron-dependent peroxidase